MEQLLMIALAISLAVCYLILLSTRRSLQNERQRKEYASRHFKRLQGCTKLWPGSAGEFVTYALQSWDGGLTWFAVEFDQSFRMTIKGAAEEIYPGLLNTIIATEKLLAHGPLDLHDQESAQLLRQAGFTVSAAKS